MTAPPMSSVLVVDDDRRVASAHARLLERLGYAAHVETDPLRVDQRLRSEPAVGLVLLDMLMPGIDGLGVLKQLRIQHPQVGVVMATVVDRIEAAVRATKQGAYNYLLKPLQTERLGQVLGAFFTTRPPALVDDPRFARFITASPLFTSVFARLQRFAEADVTVLLEGETGTGKEVLAELVHTLSPRSAGPFIAVNVAALTPHLFEGELFGYRKGAFTGAGIEHGGYLGAAAGGTLFLDEIGELGLEQQKRLLRVLQGRRYCRIGETEERALDARVVVATNRGLKDEVSAGRFRTDLYYRLNSHDVRIPPLRDRPADIPLLARYFVSKYTAQFGRMLSGLDDTALQLLAGYDFPGNVRELEGMISAAVLLEQSDTIQPESLPEHLRLERRPLIDAQDLDLERTRYQTIMRAMAECDGNQTQAAVRLGIARGTLNRLLKKYGDEPPISCVE